MEKGVQHISTVATDAALGPSKSTRRQNSAQQNGKVKRSWECVNFYNNLLMYSLKMVHKIGRIKQNKIKN